MSDIQICGICSGTGETKEDIGTHHSDYFYSTCKKCNGTGRVIVQHYRLQIPFGTDTKKWYPGDSEIRKLIDITENNCR